MTKIKKSKVTKKTPHKRLSPKTIKLIILIILLISLAGITAYSLNIFNTRPTETTGPGTTDDTGSTAPPENVSAPQQQPAPSIAPDLNKGSPSSGKPNAEGQKLAFCKDADSAASKVLVATIQDSQKYVDTKINELMAKMSDGTIDWYQFKQQRSALLSEANTDLDSAYSNYVTTVKNKGCEPSQVPPGHYN